MLDNEKTVAMSHDANLSSHTEEWLMITAIALVFVLSVYLVFFDSAAIS